MKPAAEAAFARIMADPSMPADDSPEYDRWLFVKTWNEAIAAAFGMTVIADHDAAGVGACEPTRPDRSAKTRAYMVSQAEGRERVVNVPLSGAVTVCSAHDAACVEVPAGLRCKGCPHGVGACQTEQEKP